MRTFGTWEPLQRPGFRSLLDGIREMVARRELTPDDLRFVDPDYPAVPPPSLLELAEADCMVVAEKVRAST